MAESIGPDGGRENKSKEGNLIGGASFGSSVVLSAHFLQGSLRSMLHMALETSHIFSFLVPACALVLFSFSLHRVTSYLS